MERIEKELKGKGWEQMTGTCIYSKLLAFIILLLVLIPWRMHQGHSQNIPTKKMILSTYSGKIPKEWGENVAGVKTRLNTNRKVIALTFDACGGPKGSGFDGELIHYLERRIIRVRDVCALS